ncbi:MAG: polysaccharide deacetylase family protein [Bacteroidota bacterium]
MIKKSKSKLYYKGLDIVLPKKFVCLPLAMRQRKNLFLYFDYEREFGGHKTDIADKHIFELLKMLTIYKIKATWFTVGKIFSQYPKSVHELISHGHELASHTYYHTAPYHYNSKQLQRDFDKIDREAPVDIKGFHSPNGKWSFSLLSLLNRYNYKYDVLLAKHRKNLVPFRHTWPGINKTFRLYTVGDDWGLYQKETKSEEAFHYFKNLYNQIEKGDVAGIGAHPWVLFSSSNILKGYYNFLRYLSAQNDLNVNTALYFINYLIKNK